MGKVFNALTRAEREKEIDTKESAPLEGQAVEKSDRTNGSTELEYGAALRGTPGRQTSRSTRHGADSSLVLCVDFDGTIVDHRYPEIGKPVPHAIKWLKRLNRCGASLILYTMRSDNGSQRKLLSEAVDYLESQGVELFAVNHNPSQLYWTTSPKVYANLYIDDSGFGCPLIHPPGFSRPCVDWQNVGPIVEKLCLERNCR